LGGLSAVENYSSLPNTTHTQARTHSHTHMERQGK